MASLAACDCPALEALTIFALGDVTFMQDDALQTLRQAVQADPHNAMARLELLRALVEAAQWQEATEQSMEWEQHAALAAPACLLTGIAYGKLHQWDKAVHYGRAALAQQPDDVLTLFNLGTALAQQDTLEEAIQLLRKVVNLQGLWAEAHYTLGTILLRQERYTEAIRAFEDAIEQRPLYPEAHFNRGNAHALKGLEADGSLDYYQFDCAINSYKTAIQQRPGYLAALYNLGMLYKRMASAEGLRIWEQYLEAGRDVPEEAPWLIRAEEYQRDLQDRLRSN